MVQLHHRFVSERKDKQADEWQLVEASVQHCLKFSQFLVVQEHYDFVCFEYSLGNP